MKLRFLRGSTTAMKMAPTKMMSTIRKIVYQTTMVMGEWKYTGLAQKLLFSDIDNIIFHQVKKSLHSVKINLRDGEYKHAFAQTSHYHMLTIQLSLKF